MNHQLNYIKEHLVHIIFTALVIYTFLLVFTVDTSCENYSYVTPECMHSIDFMRGISALISIVFTTLIWTAIFLAEVNKHER